MPKFELHCLYWENANPEMVQLHRACLAHLGIDVIYTNQTIHHDRWLNQLVQRRIDGLDAIGFIDIDCLPYSADAVEAALSYALTAGSFIGLAQAANHIKPQLSIYAAPAFLVISRSAFQALGKPSLRTRHRADVAQDLSLVADARGFPYRILYPIGFNHSPEGGPWRLGNYGWFGIGTEYQGGFFHLFQSRLTKSQDLFRRKATEIMAGATQPTSAPISSTDLALMEGQSTVTGRAYRRAIRDFLHRV